MLRLGIKLIAGVLMSARMIPKAMDAILRAAGLDLKTEIEVPTYTYFNNIRPMLQHMNREIIQQHCQNAQYLSLGVDESPRRIKSSNVISVVLTDENGTSCLVKVAEHNERGELQKSTYDAEKAIKILKSELGDEFKPTMKKTLNIITDSCSNAKATREKLVQKLDEIFVAFDEVIERNELEKIKTIGDAYMCASGIPDENPNQVKNVVLTGLQLVEVMNSFNEKQRLNNEPEWNVRVGIHTGELIAGVVGKKKFAYDIWGDTVNIASRMESNSEPGRVNISRQTYEEVKDFFNCEERGRIIAKNRGELEMYFVTELKSEFFSSESKSNVNQNFYE